MKLLTYFIVLFLPFTILTQEWQTIGINYNHGFEPMNQFAVNPYTNQLWFTSGTNAAVIEPSGEVVKFGEDELGTLFASSELRFGFTPNNLFYSKRLAGLHLFDDYEKQLVYFDNEITTLRNDEDTLFMRRSGAPVLKYVHNTLAEDFYGAGGSDIISKNGHTYSNIGAFAYRLNGTSVNLQSQDYHLFAPTTTFQFQNYTDTIYLGFKTGISKAHNGECFDTITPYNTNNMPSGNVLEIEFDKNDDLWVAFGDEDDNHFALARLENDTWVDIFDETNSPIDFSRFHGFEFDTLGNLWVASKAMLHTLVTQDSPEWLNTIENEEVSAIKIYPNPAAEHIYIDLPNDVPTEAAIYATNGKHIKSVIVQKDIPLNIGYLSRGVYLLKLKGNVLPVRFVKE